MKNIRLTLALACTMSMMSSCEDVLDKGHLDKYTEDVVWSDPGLAQNFIYGSYVHILKEHILQPLEAGNNYGAGSDDLTDNMIVDGMDPFLINKNTITVNKDCGWNKFSLIRRANIIIERAGASSALSQSTKAEMVAQGKMLRAMIYFKLAKMFGAHVIVDKVLTPQDNLLIPQSSIKDVYDFVIKDLEEAADGLSVDVKLGHLNKGAALALLNEVALHAAAYVGEDSYYDISKAAAEELFEMGKYTLDSDYHSMFNDYNYAGSCSEIIFALYRSKDVTQFKLTPTQTLYPNGEISQIPDDANPKYTVDFLGWANRFPSQDLVDEYEVIDEDGVAKKWNETSYFQNFRPGVDYVSSFMFKNRDKRFEASIVHDSTFLHTNLVMTRVKGSSNLVETNKGRYTNRSASGYMTRKGVNDKDFVNANGFTDYHHVLFRLGRVYLNYAEALLRTGETAKALEYINMTRTTHGGLPELSTGLSEAEAWKAYKSERRVDLYMEGDRYWSLLRWYKADGADMIPELNHGNQYFEISEDGKSYQIFEELPLAATDNNSNRVWDSRKFLLPVPQNQINLAGGVIKQTENW